MREYSDIELAELADYGEEKERTSPNPEEKKAANAMRMGADWMLRFRTKQRDLELKRIGTKEKNAERTQ